MRNGLQSFSEPHVIGQDAADIVLAKVLQEAKAFALIRAKGCLQSDWRIHQILLVSTSKSDTAIAKTRLAGPTKNACIVFFKGETKLAQKPSFHFGKGHVLRRRTAFFVHLREHLHHHLETLGWHREIPTIAYW